ncbi:MAG: NAD(P)H-dependent glycerol-3-phosphate dehydrogenase [Planctomycetaceae bacterium]
MKNVAVLGAGAMGTACAWLLAGSDQCRVRLWAKMNPSAEELNRTRCNERLLPGVVLQPSILISDDPEAVLRDADVVLVAVPMRGLRDAMSCVADQIPSTAILVSIIKGIENATLKRPTEVLHEFAPSCQLVAIGGPCHAEEITRQKPASIVAASNHPEAAETVQQLMSRDFLRMYVSEDLVGVELGGALKNVIAIAAGICDGLEFGDNARAAVMTRGLNEMVRFGQALGANPATFYGLAGIGDLITTCCSQHSRNRFVGDQLGQGKTLEEIEASMHAVAEGVLTSRSVFKLAAERSLEMPIAEQIHSVLFEGKHPKEATIDLMNRPLKSESILTQPAEF